MSVNDVVFCIPSYKRHERQDTLEYLLTIGIPKKDIFLFVQTENDYRLYKNYSYDCNLVYAVASTLPNARNNIINYFNGSENIIMMDDDISVISIGSADCGCKLKEIHDSEKLYYVINKMQVLAKRFAASMFGFYPVYNAFFMQDSIDLKKPINTILGLVKGFNERFDVNFIAKEDIELCGRILSSGGNIVRCNNVSFKAKHRTNHGGANEIWKSGVNREFASLLEAMYPEVYAVQKGNPEEVRTITKGGRMELEKWKI